ncbi:MAG: bifunctional 3-deoxy-7-phosphoheptulonate synthase/chorismate mutase type II [Muribaculaceae bacterium]|nr:bifunctional 3-deoxy-7-phosphoheptulonate synthase/chorismate mutase type II [Muribaculaceae bacterium]
MALRSLQDVQPLEFRGVEPGMPVIIAGPCSAESERQTLDAARALSAIGVTVFRAGIWKPRTMPGGFEGIGDRGLAWLQAVRRETGMMVATEVATIEHVHAALGAGIDILWIGARTSTNPFAMQDIANELRGHREVTVLVKNPLNPDLDLWIGALQRIRNAGITRLGAVHRGFSSAGEHIYRNNPQWHIPFELRRLAPTMTILCDPSHIGGKRRYIEPLSQIALDTGFDGLMIESHCHPDEALSDSAQQVTPDALRGILERLVVRSGAPIEDELSLLRQQIDDCDHELLAVLARRMSVSREIGRFKKAHNLRVVQPARYQDMINARLDEGDSLGLQSDFTQRVMQAIHEESVRQQLDLL